MLYAVYHHPQFTDQLYEVAAWYDKERAGLGIEFLEEVDELADLISRSPLIFPSRMKASRHAALRRFPYFIIYEVNDNVIEIYNLTHASRHPIRRIMKK